jgi:hypothetical protein
VLAAVDPGAVDPGAVALDDDGADEDLADAELADDALEWGPDVEAAVPSALGESPPLRLPTISTPTVMTTNAATVPSNSRRRQYTRWGRGPLGVTIAAER